jgi:hypothetical protein
VVLGSGHSALTAISELARIVRDYPGTRVSWALRRGGAGITFGGGDGDQLPERGALGTRAREAVGAGLVDVVTGFRTERVQAVPGALILVSEDGRSLPAADRVLVLAGFRPDLSFLSEMRLELDVTLQAPVKLAAEIDPNLHSCGDVAATGAAELAHPEPDLYLAGMKSYGRAPTFLAMTGYEQVRSIARRAGRRSRGSRAYRAGAARHGRVRRLRPVRRARRDQRRRMLRHGPADRADRTCTGRRVSATWTPQAGLILLRIACGGHPAARLRARPLVQQRLLGIKRNSRSRQRQRDYPEFMRFMSVFVILKPIDISQCVLHG